MSALPGPATRKRLRDHLVGLPTEQVREVLAGLNESALKALLYDWRGTWARKSQLVPTGDWFVWLICAGRGFGKMIDVGTPIPTPSGWARLGDMNVGDALFDESGRPCRIERVFDGTPEIAYRLEFSDGTHIDACSEHQWVTWTHAERKAFSRSPYEDASRFPDEWPEWKLKRLLGRYLSCEMIDCALELFSRGQSLRAIERALGVCRASIAPHMKAGAFVARQPRIYDDSPGPRVRTTQQIVDSLRYGLRGDLNHCVPVARPLQLPDLDLPIDPYVLGAWLGDGTSQDGTFTAHEDDQPHLRSEIERAGFSTTYVSDPQRIGTRGLHTRLRGIGVIGSKHVPPKYLRASESQRLALLQGLMDTDGSTNALNSCVEFSNTNPKLVDAVTELARSLGQKPVVAEGRSRLNGVDHGPKWRVTWRPTIQVFKMKRKADRLKLDNSAGSQALRNHHRMIVNATRIDPKPMRCLTVDSRHSLFLAGEAMIPTHNTRTGAESVRWLAETGQSKRIAIIAPTSADARDVMIEGESGILACCPPWDMPHFEPSKRRLTWKNGARATLFSAEEPERLRGPQHDLIWGDEPASWVDRMAWDMAAMGLRLGDSPRAIITGTPKPVPLILELIKDKRTFVTRGSTFENKANLAPTFIDQVKRIYEGTRLGRQEIFAEVLEDVPGALFNQIHIDKARVAEAPQLERLILAIDPAPTSESGSDETGIVAVGRGVDGHAYILEDLSLRGTPDEWARKAVQAYYRMQADMIVAEINIGGEMVESVIRSVDPNVPFRPVRAMRGKAKRAEPIAALYEQGKVHHVGPPDALERLERQMRVFSGVNGRRDDRTDAMCWGVHELLVASSGFVFV